MWSPAHQIIALALFALCVSPLGFAAAAQSSSGTSVACTDEGSHEFDFWIGHWRIEQRILQQDGSWREFAAANTISKSPDACVVVEHWSGDVLFFWDGMQTPENIWGVSVRAFDPATRSWIVYWMDKRSPKFGDGFVGRFVAGRGEFFRTLNTPDGKRTTRITFENAPGGNVHWELASSSDGGVQWVRLWTMIMHRVTDAPN
ncbi:MAG: hypothetical protein KBA31_16050 [Alphaproteobacteria bacterium]|nr:hypothetical protein [Alphaproteobacteria bacterium]